jgi:hypothetical protein
MEALAEALSALSGGQEEPYPEDDQEHQDVARDGEDRHGLIPGLATRSIHLAIPPASSMTSGPPRASWHRAHAARAAGGSNTLVGRFIRTLAIVAARSSSTSATRLRVRCGLALGRRTTWPTTGCQALAAMFYGGRSAGSGSTGLRPRPLQLTW